MHGHICRLVDLHIHSCHPSAESRMIFLELEGEKKAVFEIDPAYSKQNFETGAFLH